MDAVIDAAIVPPHQALRAATQTSHEQVDRRFARFDLADSASYAAFLCAHARALPAVEAALSGRSDLPMATPRAPALAADLRSLGRPMPAPIAIPSPPSPGAAWGMFYVVEGSRLGGAMLARAVPAGLPRAYLSAAHPRGGWRALLAALDDAAARGGPTWLGQAIDAARRTFDHYDAAAAAS